MGVEVSPSGACVIRTRWRRRRRSSSGMRSRARSMRRSTSSPTRVGRRRAGSRSRSSRTLSPVDRRAGSKPVRVVGARWHRNADRAAADRDRSDVPDDPDASGDRRAGGGDERGDAAGAVLPRRRHRGEPQRARARRPVAADVRPSRDAPRGGGGDARALAGRPDEPPGDVLHGRERPSLHAARGAAGDHGRRERAEGGRACRRDRRRARRDRARPRARQDL